MENHKDQLKTERGRFNHNLLEPTFLNFVSQVSNGEFHNLSPEEILNQLRLELANQFPINEENETEDQEQLIQAEIVKFLLYYMFTKTIEYYKNEFIDNFKMAINKRLQRLKNKTNNDLLENNIKFVISAALSEALGNIYGVININANPNSSPNYLPPELNELEKLSNKLMVWWVGPQNRNRFKHKIGILLNFRQDMLAGTSTAGVQIGNLIYSSLQAIRSSKTNLSVKELFEKNSIIIKKLSAKNFEFSPSPVEPLSEWPFDERTGNFELNTSTPIPQIATFSCPALPSGLIDGINKTLLDSDELWDYIDSHIA